MRGIELVSKSCPGHDFRLLFAVLVRRWGGAGVLLGLVLCSGLAAAAEVAEPASSGEALTPITLQLRWKHQFQFAGYHAAVEKGFYRDAGFEVTLIEGSPDHNPVVEVLTGRAQFAVDNSGVLFERLQGKPLVALAVIFQHSPSVLLARGDSGISTPQDLIGKRIMLIGGTNDADLLAMLANEGVKSDQLNIQRSSFEVDDLVKGRTDAFNAYTTNEPFYLTSRGIPASIIEPRRYGIDFYSDILFTAEEEIREHPEQVKAFREASLKGWEYAMAHPEEMIDLLITKYGVQKTREHLRFEYEEMRELILPDLVELGHMNPGRWRHMADTFVSVGMAPADYSLDGFVLDFNPPPDYTMLRRVGALSVFLLVFAAGFAVWNWQLRRSVAERTAELSQLRNYLANIIDSMPSVLVGVDADGTVTQWNNAAARCTGLSQEDAVGQPLEDSFPRLAGEIERVREAMGSQQTLHEPKQARYEDGETYYEDITIYPLAANGVEGVVIRVDDVTERIRIEEMMIQTEKMMSVGGLAAGMAHEINNPLAGILQNMQVLQNRISCKLEKNRAAAEACGTSMEIIEAYMEERGIPRMVEAVIGSGKRAAKIVDNMLAFSRKSTSAHVPQDLGGLMDQVIELAENDYDLKKRYDFRRITIQREYDPSVGKVTCEGSTIQQVLLNLLKNGAQAMAAVEREEPRLILRVLPDGDMARLEVEDNGPGMKEEVRRRVFEPFFTTKDDGTGLGLSVSFFIVTENHRGRMSVESELGQGTKFIIQLPGRRS